MEAKNYEIGRKFKHINRSTVTVVQVDNEKYFENEDGDLFSYIDTDYILYEV